MKPCQHCGKLGCHCNRPVIPSDSQINQKQVERINHPSHYTVGRIEVIDFIEDQGLGFHDGNVVKYVCRAKHKGSELEDLKKARWYLDRLIQTKEPQNANIVQPYAKIVDVPDREAGIVLLRFCEQAARISHRSEESRTPDSWERFLRFVVMGHGDFSVIEHRSVTVEFLVDRGITHEIVRHRLAAFTQESTRFVNYEKKMPPSFVAPLTPEQINEYAAWDSAINSCEQTYKYLLSKGVAPQIARSVFPNALASKLWMTANLRMWRHFLLMRTSAEAHPQMRQVTIPLLEEFQAKIPLLYEDIVPLRKQSENMKQMR